MDYNEQLEKERREEEQENAEILIEKIEEYNQRYPKKQFQGIDADLTISLYEYGFLLQEEKPGEYFIIYCDYLEGRYFSDWTTVDKEDLIGVIKDIEISFFKFVDTGENEIIREIKRNNIGAIINTIDSINSYNGYFNGCLNYNESLERWINWFDNILE